MYTTSTSGSWSDLAATSASTTGARIATIDTCNVGTYATLSSSAFEPSLLFEEEVAKVKCKDGETRSFRDYVLWVMNGCKKKVELMKAPEVKQTDMLI